MSRAPFVTICIDGHNAVEMGRTIHALMDIPCVGKEVPINTQAHLTVLREVKGLYQFLPGIIIAPSAVEAVLRGASMRCVPWEYLYEQKNTLFITLKENISEELKTQGSEFLLPLLRPRILRQQQYVQISRALGGMGYRTRMIDDIGTPMDVAHKIIDEIRLTQRNILEHQRDSQGVD